MITIRKVTDEISYIGANDRRIAMFENLIPLTNGVSYNSYFIDDEKTAVLDTVDRFVSDAYFENLEYLLHGRKLDYLIVHHMEPDHGANIGHLLELHPDIKVVCTAKANQMITQFFGIELGDQAIVVKEGDKLNLGKHTLNFVMAPMVHWPEVMFSYEESEKILFTADAFGSFGALDGKIFNDEVDVDEAWYSEARRYYTNIVGKYGPNTQTVLKKAAKLDIKMIAPLHGLIWRTNASDYLAKYDLWSRYEPEVKGVLVAYASMYGGTESAANALSLSLADKGIRNMVVRDVSVTDTSELLSLAFKYSHVVIACPTYNANIHPMMEHFITDMKNANLQNRTFALIENGSWAPMAAKVATDMLSGMKNCKILDEKVTIKSALRDAKELEAMANAIVADINA